MTDQNSSTVLLTGWQIVLQPSTTTTLSSSANPSVVGQPVTYTATAGHPGAFATLWFNGALIVWSAGGMPIWGS